MKKLLTIIILFVAVNSFGQVRTFLGPKGQFIYDTTKSLNVLGTYLLLPNDSTLNFDSTKVVTNVTKNATGDSFYIYKGGVLSSVLKDSSGGGSSGWALTGNAGTVAGTNFVGTTDDIDLQFKRRSRFSGIIDSTGVAAGITSFGYMSGGLAGYNNTAMGFRSLAAVTTSGVLGNNVAIGSLAMAASTSANQCVAVGANALAGASNAADAYYTAVGYDALLVASGGVLSPP